MKISKDFRPFTKPTIIVLTDQEKAKIFLAQNRQLEEITTLTTEAERITDTEAMTGEGPYTHNKPKKKAGGQNESFTGQGPYLASTPEKREHDHHMIHDHLYPMLNDDLMKRLQNKEFEELIIFVNEMNKNILEEQLHDYLKQRLTVIPAEVTKEPMDKILQRIQSA
jgi:hypothetical protein